MALRRRRRAPRSLRRDHGGAGRSTDDRRGARPRPRPLRHAQGEPTESDQDPFEPDCIEQAAIRRDEDGADTEQAPEGYEDDETGEGHS